MKVAMIAPPWLTVPPEGYGGIEWMVSALMGELLERGVEIELFAVGACDVLRELGANVHSFAPTGRYHEITGSLYDTVAMPVAHVVEALAEIAQMDDVDVIHDHNGFIGPAACAFLDPSLFPPVLHTVHGPFTEDEALLQGVWNNRRAFDAFGSGRRLWFNGISHAQLRTAPHRFRARCLGAVYNGIDPEAFPLRLHKDDHFLTLARVCADKGQGMAARICARDGHRLVLAGAVPGGQVDEHGTVTDEPHNPYTEYYVREVAPHVQPGRVEFVGEVGGQDRLDLLSRARALLFPIDWEEPFGIAIVEALACGTPVVAMRRGAAPELIEHGVTGFLADDERSFAGYLRQVDSIDPRDCRRAVEQRFSASSMADGYLHMYERIATRTSMQDINRRAVLAAR